MHPTQHTGRRHRAVGLLQIEWVAGESGECGIGEPFEEEPTRVGMNLRGDLPCAGDGQFAGFHLPRSAYPASTASFSGRHHDSLSRYHSMVARSPSSKSACFGPQPSSSYKGEGSMAYRRSWPARSVTWSKSSESQSISRRIVRMTDRLSRSPSAPMRYVRPI